MMSLVTEQLDSSHLNQVTEFKAIFQKCEMMANFSNVLIVVPSIIQRQTMCSNFGHNSPEEYFRKSFFLLFWMACYKNYTNRFQGKSKDCIRAIVLVPNNLQDCDVEPVNTINSLKARLPR